MMFITVLRIRLRTIRPVPPMHRRAITPLPDEGIPATAHLRIPVRPRTIMPRVIKERAMATILRIIRISIILTSTWMIIMITPTQPE